MFISNPVRASEAAHPQLSAQGNRAEMCRGPILLQEASNRAAAHGTTNLALPCRAQVSLHRFRLVHSPDFNNTLLNFKEHKEYQVRSQVVLRYSLTVSLLCPNYPFLNLIAS